MCDIICCETGKSAGVLQGAACVPVSLLSQKPGMCCMGNTDLPELVTCSVWLPSTLAGCPALRSSRDLFPLPTLNYSVNISLEMSRWKFLTSCSMFLRSLLSDPRGPWRPGWVITRLFLSLESQTLNLDVFHGELYKLCSFVFCDVWLKNSSHCFLWMRLALVNPSDFWYL